MDSFRADACIAALFALAGTLGSALVDSHGHSRAITALAAVAASIPLA
jgi:hypothetical protein